MDPQLEALRRELAALEAAVAKTQRHAATPASALPAHATGEPAARPTAPVRGRGRRRRRTRALLATRRRRPTRVGEPTPVEQEDEEEEAEAMAVALGPALDPILGAYLGSAWDDVSLARLSPPRPALTSPSPHPAATPGTAVATTTTPAAMPAAAATAAAARHGATGAAPSSLITPIHARDTATFGVCPMHESLELMQCSKCRSLIRCSGYFVHRRTCGRRITAGVSKPRRHPQSRLGVPLGSSSHAMAGLNPGLGLGALPVPLSPLSWRERAKLRQLTASESPPPPSATHAAAGAGAKARSKAVAGGVVVDVTIDTDAPSPASWSGEETASSPGSPSSDAGSDDDCRTCWLDVGDRIKFTRKCRNPLLSGLLGTVERAPPPRSNWYSVRLAAPVTNASGARLVSVKARRGDLLPLTLPR